MKLFKLLAAHLAPLLCGAAIAAQTVPSGLDDIDRTAREVAASPTTAANRRERISMLSSWCRLLLHQGIDLSPAEPALARIARGDLAQNSSAGSLAAIDESFRLLGEIQAHPTKHSIQPGPADRVAGSPANRGTDWGLYHGGHDQAGYTDDPGPSAGKLAWRFPIGHQWYAAPSVENGRVYVASPGLVTVAYCLDERNGGVIWKAKQFGLASYREPRVASGVVVLKDKVIVRETGSGGEQRNAVNLVYLDKQTGKIAERVRAGHVDYRRGCASVAGSNRYLACPRGYQAIQNRPPLVWMMNTVALKDAATGKNLWELRVGDIFGDPVVDGDEVFVATAEGILYALNAAGQSRVRWTFDARAALPGTPEVTVDTVIVGANNGTLHALDRRSGAARWSFQAPRANPHAFQFFSASRTAGDRVYVGAADKNLYCLDARSGALVWRVELGDWVRARPLVVGDSVLVGTMDGNVHAFAHGGPAARRLWTSRASTHQILADLVGTSAGVLVSSNDLFLSSLDPRTGGIQWRHSLLEAATIEGERVPADVVSGGADYQSPPAVVDGIVYVGGPNRFVYAVRAESGQEIWRYETSGQVSGQPVVVEGRVYFGQQGGDKNFYCVAAKTGDLLWKKPLGWAWVSAGCWGDMLYVGTVEGDIHGVRAADGERVWTHRTNGGVYPALATDAHNVYTGSWDGYYFALARDSGQVRWAHFLGGSPDSAAPILWKGNLLIQALSRYLGALDAKTGEPVWKFDVPAGYDINATPAAHGDRVFASVFRVVNYTPCGARLFCLDDKTGKPIWEFRPGGGLTGAVVARDRVYFASTADVFFTCVDAKGNGDGTTNLIWRYRMGGVVEESCPAIYGRRAFVLCSDRYLYAFE